jgi:hypothetical protein
VHVQRTYPALTPYLKGLHLTIDGWHPNQDSEGWRDMTTSLQGYWDERSNSWVDLQPSTMEAPAKVTPVPRLHHDLSCLEQLVRAATPPLHYICLHHIKTASYCFGDASGNSIGSSLSQGNKLTIRYGT